MAGPPRRLREVNVLRGPTEPLTPNEKGVAADPPVPAGDAAISSDGADGHDVGQTGGEAAPKRKRNAGAIAQGLPTEPPEGFVRVYSPRASVLGIHGGQWGDIKIGTKHLEECLRKRLVLIESEAGNPAPAQLPERRCAGCGGAH